MIGALLALMSAATFALNSTALRRGVLTGTPLQAMSITVPIGVPLFALGAWLWGGFAADLGISGQAVLWFSIAGVIHFVLGRYGNYRATRALGANLSGPIQQMSILVALGLALAFLGETLSPLKLVGLVLVVGGPVIMLRSRRGKPGATARSFQPAYAEGYFFGALCALGYGSSPLFITWGLQGGGVRAGLVGGLISYAAATAAIACILVLPQARKEVGQIERTPGRWFVVSGLLVFISQMFRYVALSLAPVTIVVPIQRLSVVFRVVFGWLMNRDHESFGFWTLFGIFVSTLGAVALTIDVGWIAALLPPALVDALQWRWP